MSLTVQLSALQLGGLQFTPNEWMTDKQRRVSCSLLPCCLRNGSGWAVGRWVEGRELTGQSSGLAWLFPLYQPPDEGTKQHGRSLVQISLLLQLCRNDVLGGRKYSRENRWNVEETNVLKDLQQDLHSQQRHGSYYQTAKPHFFTHQSGILL